MKRRLCTITAVSVVLAFSACGRPLSAGDTASTPASSARVTTSPPSTPSACPLPSIPAARSSMVFTYMPDRSEAVLFGGRLAGNQLGSDTWIWKGGCWAEATQSISPGARDGAASAYDSVHKNVVVYGGRSPGVLDTDTWVWDGITWTKAGTSGPQVVYGSVAGFDPVTQRVLLFGGLASGGAPSTWSWDGAAWKQLSPASSPEGRDFGTMALDPTLHQLMLFGGFNASSGVLNDTWDWDGANWIRRVPVNSPPARAEAAMTTWSAGDVVLLWGGLGASATGVLSDAWKWDGTNWSQIASPGASSDAAAIDTGPKALFFGGGNANGYQASTWTWDGLAWSQL
jgi:hypothetical protein